MKTITIRGLPDEVHARLKEQARKNRRSLNQEVIAELAGKPSAPLTQKEEKVRSLLAESDAVYRTIQRPISLKDVLEAEVGF